MLRARTQIIDETYCNTRVLKYYSTLVSEPVCNNIIVQLSRYVRVRVFSPDGILIDSFITRMLYALQLGCCQFYQVALVGGRAEVVSPYHHGLLLPSLGVDPGSSDSSQAFS